MKALKIDQLTKNKLKNSNKNNNNLQNKELILYQD